MADNKYALDAQIHTIKTEIRSLAAETGDFDNARFTELKSELENLEAQKLARSYAEELESRSAANTAENREARKLENEITLVDAIRSQLTNTFNGAIQEYDAEMRSKGMSPIEAGGILLPASVFETRAAGSDETSTSIGSINYPDYRPGDLIKALRNKTLIDQLGVRNLGSLKGNPVVPKQTAKAQTYWVAEDGVPPTTSVTYGQLTMSPKHVLGLTSISQQALQQSVPGIDALVTEDLAKALALEIDTQLLYGDGTAGKPTGFIPQAVTAGSTGSLSTLSWAGVLKLIAALRAKNIDPSKVLLSQSAAVALGSTLKAQAAGCEFIYDGGNVAGLPAVVSNQIPDSGDGKATSIVLGDFSEVFVGSWNTVSLLVNPYGDAYNRAGIQVRVGASVDTVLRRPEALTVVSDLKVV